MMLRSRSLILAVALCVPALSFAQSAVPDGAALLGRPVAEIENLDSRTITFPTVGVTATVVKATEIGTGRVLSVCVDSRGRSVDLSAVRRQEIEARHLVPFAKLQKDLAKKMLESPDDEVIPVVAWLRFDADVLDAFAARRLRDVLQMTHAQLVAAEQEVADFVIARNAEVTAPFVALARAEGLAATFTSRTAPAVFFELNKAAVLGLAGLAAVDTVYLQRNDRTDGNNDANRTHRTDRVHSYGVRGTLSTVAMLEDNGLDPACPHLDIAGWFNPGNPDPDNHIHGTAGCVASRLASRLGSAPDVRLLSANATTYSDCDVTDAADWIQASTSAGFTNLSFGGNYSGAEQYLDRYFDYQSRHFRDSYVAAAGNSGLGGSVGSPGTAWNCLTVGSFNDFEDADWTGDAMSSFSSTQNPASGCEKPNLAANGHNVDTLGNAAGNWLTNGYDGTSFAAPHVTGNLANVADTGTFANMPEAAMALMMATAWHNIEGSSRLSGEDGAGGLHGLAAFRARHQVDLDMVSASDFNNNGFYTRTITLQGGDRARVCIAWSANANSGYSTTVLDADLDLAVFGGANQTSGTFYGGSSSFNNNFEIVEFTPPVSGSYTIRVNDYRFDGTNEHLAMAWTQRSDGAYGRLRESAGETGATAGPTLGNPAYGMHLSMPGSPGLPFIVYPSGTMFSGLPVSTQTWFPLDIDIWTGLWQDHLTTGAWFWTNTSATLSASGTYSGFSMELPSWPTLPGFELFHVGATVDFAYPDSIKEISEVHRFHFWPSGVDQVTTDDGFFVQPLPFGFEFFGTTYTECYVNMNGNITFGSGDGDFSESVAEFLSDQPRIAAAWDDLEPNQSGSQGASIVRVREVYQGEQRVVIEFINVGEYQSTPGSSGSNTFRYTLADDGSITIDYRDVTLDDCIVGVSPGNGQSSASEVDLSSWGYRGLVGGNSAVFEHFSGGGDDFDLGSGQSIFSPTYWKRIRFVPAPAFFGGIGYRAELDL